MTKLIIAGGLALLQATAVTAQKAPDPAKADTKTTPVMTAPVRTPITRVKTTVMSEIPPAATAPGQNSSNFYLTSTKVTIYTGNDNKEAPSQMQLQMILGAEGVSSNWESKEFAVNSATEIIIKPYYDRHYYPEKIRLVNTEKGGVKLFINYSPNFLLDAWKIEKVLLTMEFRDDNGNLHPVMGTKNIQFVNIGALLNNSYSTLLCEADQFLIPKNTSVLKRF